MAHQMPLVRLMLPFTTGLSLSEIFLTLVMVEVTVVSGLSSGLIPTSYKWGFYAFGASALLHYPIAIRSSLTGFGHASARTRALCLRPFGHSTVGQSERSGC